MIVNNYSLLLHSVFINLAEPINSDLEVHYIKKHTCQIRDWNRIPSKRILENKASIFDRVQTCHPREVSASLFLFYIHTQSKYILNKNSTH